MKRFSTLIIVSLLTSISFAEETDRPDDKAKTSFARNPRLAVAKLPQSVQKHLVRRGRAPKRIITTSSVSPAPVVPSVPPPAAKPKATPQPQLCQIFFQEAHATSEQRPFAQHSGAVPYYDEDLKALESERIITWVKNHFKHVLQLTSNPPFTKGRYVTYVVQRGVSQIVTNQSHYEAFIGELNRMMVIDPNLAIILKHAQIDVPVVDLQNVPKPNPRIILLTPVYAATDVVKRYQGTTGRSAFAFYNRPLEVQAPGKLVWQANELKHVLYLRDVGTVGRGSYETYLSGYMGEVRVTHEDFLDLFRAELNRVRALNPEIQLALDLAGIKP